MLAAGWHPQPHRRPTPSRLHRLTRRRRRITSKKRAEFIRGHTNNGQDVSQRPFGHVPTCVDWDWDGSAIRVLHHVVTTDDPLHGTSGAFERPYNLRSRYNWDAARHKRGSYQKSGDVECQSQLVWWLNYIEQSFKRGAQVVDRFFLRRAIADRANARAE